MKLFRALLCAAILLTVVPRHGLIARGQQGSSAPPPIRVTSNLVFLDVTVLDKNSRPVVNGLRKDDFTITEDNKPQPIFSFEPPETHVTGAAAKEGANGKSPVTIFVLDLLNSSSDDFSYIREKVRGFLMAQPAQLASPTELIVINNESLEMLQGYTRSRADLLYALNHLPTEQPYKYANRLLTERFYQSLYALQEVALQSKGVPGRKNIIWLGRGAPNVLLGRLDYDHTLLSALKQYVHSTTNMLVDARISLFVIYPDLRVADVWSPAVEQAEGLIRDEDPFVGDINFGVFANETGGELFYGRNDVDREIEKSEQMGGEYYTLTYQPENVDPNGEFRRIRVTLRNPNLRAVTKAGYFAPDKKSPVDQQQQNRITLAEAVQSTIPFDALAVRLLDVVKHPDSRTAEFIVELKSKNLTFQPTDDGKEGANVTLVAASLDQYGDILASRVQWITLKAPAQDPSLQPDGTWRIHLTIPVPRKTKRVRVAIEDQDGGRIGSAVLDYKRIAAARETPTPKPLLVRRQG